MFRRTALQPLYLSATLLLLVFAGAFAQTPPPAPVPLDGDFGPPPTGSEKPLPADVILIKGTEPSASDHKTPLPEQGKIVKGVYQNRYFGISYPLPENWSEPFAGPPPSDTGTYVMATIVPSPNFKGSSKGIAMFTAQDMFFSLTTAENAKEFVSFRRDHLEPYYDLERPPGELTIAGKTWARFDYESKVAGIHWVVLATQIRCHAVQVVFSSQDPKLLEKLVKDMDRMTLPAEAGAEAGKGGGDWPLCVADYAIKENIVEKVDPVLKDRMFNAIPVRVIIDQRGKVTHIHFLSAFPGQAEVITDALLKWRFKPYLRDGKPVEIETGIMFGVAPLRKLRGKSPAVTAAKTED